MKKIKAMKLLAVVAAAAMVTACGNSRKSGAQSMQDMPEGTTEQTFDSLKLISIKDNDGDKFMPNKLFYGTEDSSKVEHLSPNGSVPSSISCFLIEKGGKKILFDTGIGKSKGGMLMQRLDSLGISPADIDYLVLTHFHMDHIGGMVDNGKPVFANAEVYVPQKEYEYWMGASGENAEAARQAMDVYGDKVVRFGYDDTLPMGIKPMAAPGHTPGHTVYRIDKIFIAGDLMHGFDLQIQDLTICPDYDMDRKQAIESRKKYIDYVKKNKLVAAGMHFPGNGIKSIR